MSTGTAGWYNQKGHRFRLQFRFGSGEVFQERLFRIGNDIEATIRLGESSFAGCNLNRRRRILPSLIIRNRKKALFFSVDFPPSVTYCSTQIRLTGIWLIVPRVSTVSAGGSFRTNRNSSEVSTDSSLHPASKPETVHRPETASRQPSAHLPVHRRMYCLLPFCFDLILNMIIVYEYAGYFPISSESSVTVDSYSPIANVKSAGSSMP